MTSIELIVRTLGSLSDDLVKVKGDLSKIAFDLEALQRALVRLEEDINNANN